jgi:hypothetical protein
VMPRKNRRKNRRVRRNNNGREPNQDALNLIVPSFKKPDFLRITHSTQIQLAESLGDAYFLYLR